MNIQNFHIGAGDLFIDSENIGATTADGIIINYEPEVHQHKSGKYGNTPVKASLIGETLTIEVTMAESTLENMLKAYAGVTVDDENDISKLKFGGISGGEIEGKIIILAPYDGTANWTFENAVPTSSVAMAYTVEDERVFKVTFTGMMGSLSPRIATFGFLS